MRAESASDEGADCVAAGTNFEFGSPLAQDGPCSPPAPHPRWGRLNPGPGRGFLRVRLPGALTPQNDSSRRAVVHGKEMPPAIANRGEVKRRGVARHRERASAQALGEHDGQRSAIRTPMSTMMPTTARGVRRKGAKAEPRQHPAAEGRATLAKKWPLFYGASHWKCALQRALGDHA